MSIEYTSGEVLQQKRASREVVVLEHCFAGSGAHKPRRELEGSALYNFVFGFSRLTSEFVQYPRPQLQKASVKIQHFGRENSNHTLARCFFYQHCFTKVIDTYCHDEKHRKQLSINAIGKPKKSLW